MNRCVCNRIETRVQPAPKGQVAHPTEFGTMEVLCRVCKILFFAHAGNFIMMFLCLITGVRNSAADIIFLPL